MCKLLYLESNIYGSALQKLLDLCFEESVYFSFTRVHPNKHLSREETIAYLEFLQELSPYFVKSITTTHWYGGYLPEKVNLFWYIFRSEQRSKEILKAHIIDLFLEDKRAFPENLCFFTKDALLLATVSHAEFCTVFPHFEEIESQLMRLGKWRRVNLEIPWEEWHLEV